MFKKKIKFHMVFRHEESIRDLLQKCTTATGSIKTSMFSVPVVLRILDAHLDMRKWFIQFYMILKEMECSEFETLLASVKDPVSPAKIKSTKIVVFT